MKKLLYIPVAVSMSAFTMCAIGFAITNDPIQYLLAIVNLCVLASAICTDADVGF